MSFYLFSPFKIVFLHLEELLEDLVLTAAVIAGAHILLTDRIALFKNACITIS